MSRIIICILLPTVALLTTTTSALSFLPTNHQCAIDSNPSVTGWKSGQGHCQELGGRLCTAAEYCPDGQLPSGGLIKTTNHIRQWAPTSDGLNAWVLLTNFTNNNGHLGTIAEVQYDTGAVTGAVCMHDDLTQTPIDWTSLHSAAQDIVVTCCTQQGAPSSGATCTAGVTFQQAEDQCASNGLRLCTPIELQHDELSKTSTCCTGDCLKKRTWTSTPCLATHLPTGVSSTAKPLEHSTLPCTLSSASSSQSTTSFDQLGNVLDYAIANVVPASTAATAVNMIDSSDSTSYWEPGIAVGGEFVLDVGRVGLSATHLRVVMTTAETANVAVYSSYRTDVASNAAAGSTRKHRANFTVSPDQRVYSLHSNGDQEEISSSPNFGLVDRGDRYYWIYIQSKTGSGNVRIHDIGLMSRSGENPPWGMSDVLGRPFLNYVKCCNVPTAKTTLVSSSNHGGGGEGTGGWSCQLSAASVDSIRVQSYIKPPYHTTTGCTGSGIDCTSTALYSAVECANHCGIMNAVTDATTDTSFYHYRAKQLSTTTVAVTSITAGVVVGAALASAPVVGDTLRIENAPGKTCGTTGVFAVTVADSATGYTLDTDMATVADATLCVIGRDILPICKCMINVPNSATDAYGSNVLFVAGQSSTCVRTEYVSCKEAYEKGATISGEFKKKNLKIHSVSQ